MSISEIVDAEQTSNAEKTNGNDKPICRYHNICRNYERRDMYCNAFQGFHAGLDITKGCYKDRI